MGRAESNEIKDFVSNNGDLMAGKKRLLVGTLCIRIHVDICL